MKIARLVGTNPREVATKIVEQLKTIPAFTEMAAKTEVAGPGFINIMLKQEFLEKALREMLMRPHFGIEPVKKEKIVIDFSSPNVAKEMHVGHLRSTIIGDCLARIFEFFGDTVIRLNHIGDWGTSFGMLIAYIQQYKKIIDTATLQDLMQYYKTAKELFDNDLEFKRRSQESVVALQSGEREVLNIWKKICHISRAGYQAIYDLLDVKIIERGESFYNEMLAPVVQDLEKKGLVTVSEGAKCIYLEGFFNRQNEPLPLMIQKSDGGYNYDTTDMAAIKHRIETERADRIIIVTDAGQVTHFQMVFAAAEKAGYLDRTHVRVDHIPFGLVLGADGKKFRTRAGGTERLIDLLNAAVTAAENILKERGNVAEDELHTIAVALGIGAVKYADLSSHRVSDYTFSYERMLRFEGNTAPFIMYSYVRTISIQRKIGIDPTSLIGKEYIRLKHPSEIDLGLRLLQFVEALNQVADELLPNRLTDYLYSLAETFNAFFRDCRVEGSVEQASRLLLTYLTGKVLHQGLQLLGIHPVERM